MNCEICGKNEATIHIQEIINGKKKVLHICKVCAETKKAAEELLSGLDLAKLMYNISAEINSQGIDSNSGKDGLPMIKCSNCGWDIASFSNSGRLGCADCFQTFKPILSEAIRNMHKGIRHIGKRPSAVDTDKKASVEATSARIIELEKRLKEHIQREEYEKAAETRDAILALKAELGVNQQSKGK